MDKIILSKDKKTLSIYNENHVYLNVEEVLNTFGNDSRETGQTFKIKTEEGLKEYWFKDGILNENLVLKTDDNVTKEDHTSDVVIGAIKPGDKITKGTNVDELLDKLLSQTRYPKFVNPTFSSSNNAGSNREIGETFNLTITTTFNKGSINIEDGLGVSSKQNDRAGNAESYTINGTTQASNARTFSVKCAASNSFTSSVKYLEGPQPKDSKGNDFDLPLPAGELSSTTSFTSYYKTFYGPSKVSTTPRTLTTANSNINSLTLNTGVVENQFDIYVIQSKSLSQVIDQDALNANITSQYVLQGNVNIPDGGGTNVSYKHYRMKQAVPYSSSHRHLITLT